MDKCILSCESCTESTFYVAPVSRSISTALTVLHCRIHGELENELAEDTKRVGKKGEKFRYKLLDIKRKVMPYSVDVEPSIKCLNAFLREMAGCVTTLQSYSQH